MIRTLEPTDAADMAALHVRSITPAWPESDMVEHTQRDICLGLGQPLEAFIILRRADDQGEILTIVTDPDQRQRGHGRRLLQAAEAKMREEKGKLIFLEVAEDNDPAIALYRAVGFNHIGRRPAYYRRPEGRVAAQTYCKRLDA